MQGNSTFREAQSIQTCDKQRDRTTNGLRLSQNTRPLVHSLVKKGQKAKQIEQECRSQGSTGSLSTLNTMIAEERKQTK
ncbi:hypothetical protein AKG34_11440 [Peribacillus butanolivorans]|nr:hypothetical protein AKG34_11440 [Peribacillus butanolivorans]